jgi:hypothetical protein
MQDNQASKAVTAGTKRAETSNECYKSSADVVFASEAA